MEAKDIIKIIGGFSMIVGFIGASSIFLSMIWGLSLFVPLFFLILAISGIFLTSFKNWARITLSISWIILLIYFILFSKKIFKVQSDLTMIFPIVLGIIFIIVIIYYLLFNKSVKSLMK
ncbi:MAG: hypothetical protein AAB866_01705 [Patescibacteria group bacterium]